MMDACCCMPENYRTWPTPYYSLRTLDSLAINTVEPAAPMCK